MSVPQQKKKRARKKALHLTFLNVFQALLFSYFVETKLFSGSSFFFFKFGLLLFFFLPRNTLTSNKQAAENQTLALLIMSQQKKNKTPLFCSTPFCSFRNCKREFQNVVLNFVYEFLNFTGFSEFTFHKVLLGVTWHCFSQNFSTRKKTQEEKNKENTLYDNAGEIGLFGAFLFDFFFAQNDLK